MGYISQERFREDWIELNNRMRALRTWQAAKLKSRKSRRESQLWSGEWPLEADFTSSYCRGPHLLPKVQPSSHFLWEHPRWGGTYWNLGRGRGVGMGGKCGQIRLGMEDVEQTPRKRRFQKWSQRAGAPNGIQFIRIIGIWGLSCFPCWVLFKLLMLEILSMPGLKK